MGDDARVAVRYANLRRLGWSILITFAILLVEIIGGILSNSMALLSDAGHVLVDLMALILSFLTLRFATAPSTRKKTYGFHRFEILSALVNGVTLIIVSLIILYKGYQRLLNPPEVKSALMLLIAGVGLAGNVAGMAILGHGRKNLNIRGAFLHIAGDALSSVGVIAGGLIITFTRWYIIDPLLAMGLCVIILRGAYKLIGESVDILIEAVPKGIDLQDVVSEIMKINGVTGMHDLHLWSVTSEIYAMSGHMMIDKESAGEANSILEKTRCILYDRFGIEHTTIQIESEHCGYPDVMCKIHGRR
jgi:cobalt-zinc-cadmium efflux system protein